MSLPRDILTIAQADVEYLVANRVREGPHLDFKRSIALAWDSPAKHEFLADVTAFANSGGGDLVYGVDEDGDAQAVAVVPQVVASADQEVRRLQDFLLNLAEPRIPGIQIQAVPVTVGGVVGHVFIVRAPQSWVGPHRVKTNQHFFIRDGLRKRQLDVPEIRQLFLRSESQTQRLRDFRTERIGRIMSGEAPQRLVDGPVLVVHLIPTQAGLGLVQIDPVLYATQRLLPAIGAAASSARLNMDGALMVRNTTPQGETHGYSQFFRNGFFEATYVLPYREEPDRPFLLSTSYEEYLIRLLAAFRVELRHLEIDEECAVMLSLIRAKEVKLAVRNHWGFAHDHQTLFDRTTVVLPDVVANADISPELALKPVFDLVWQAAGFSGSQNYNAAGRWAPQR